MTDTEPPAQRVQTQRGGSARLAFGSAPLGDLYALLPEEQAIDTLSHALRRGIGLIDTSPLYGHGLAEHRIGAALRLVPEARPLLSTKIGRVIEPHGSRGDGSGYFGGLPHAARFDYSYDGAMRSIEQSLLRLGVGRLDQVLIHDIDRWTHGDAQPMRVAEAERGALRALYDLRQQGVISTIGIGVNETEIASDFVSRHAIDAVLLAGRYSLLEQPALTEFLPKASVRGISVMLGGVFNSGILATGAIPGARYNYRPAPPDIQQRVASIQAICARFGVRLVDAAMQFAAAHPAVGWLVMGAVKAEEIDAQIAALDAEIPSAFWRALQSGGLLNPDAPVPS